MTPLLPVAEALERVLASATGTPPVQEMALLDALGAVLASDMVAGIAVPGEANSAMDGYALRAADATKPLPVSMRIAAGAPGGAFLAEGTAARIFTGAAVPPGADAVVMQENCLEQDSVVTVSGPVTPGQNIRPRGQDIEPGATVLTRGRKLRPQDMGLLASMGLSRVPVYRPLRVAVLSTGDELVEPGTAALRSGQLYNSNRYTLAGLVRSLGMTLVDRGIVPDDPAATADALAEATQNRLLEGGRFPGLDAALEAAKMEAEALEEPGADDDPNEPPEPANENDVRELERAVDGLDGVHVAPRRDHFADPADSIAHPVAPGVERGKASCRGQVVARQIPAQQGQRRGDQHRAVGAHVVQRVEVKLPLVRLVRARVDPTDEDAADQVLLQLEIVAREQEHRLVGQRADL